ncbi:MULTISPECIES: alpha/beta hydrolase [Caldisericum]|jgi:pimeloyl-ACP methyl ester carboxylesterase|uniref:alpha/beta hydrolase n=1 Tax=Caldisericum TaxID=693074 RepID=UPI0039FBF1D6
MEDLPKILEGVKAWFVETPRLKQFVRVPERKGSDVPVLFVHGNFTSGTYFEETIVSLSDKFYGIVPDLRGYGLTEDKVIDATLGFRDWSNDLKELLDALNLKNVHLVGWSMGSGIAMQFTIDYPEIVRSLTLISPVSPFGFGGTKDLKGTPCYEDFAGSGGGTVNPDFVQRIKEHDTSDLDPNSPRNVINNFYYKPPFRAKREEDYLRASLLIKIGPDRYPGDFVPSPNWPNVAPGKFGPVNAMSPKYVNLSSITKIKNKIPILWVRGEADLIVSDNSFFDFGYLGKMGFIPNYPGEDVYPPQPMVSQMRFVLEQYKENGGKYFEEVMKDCAHSPHIEKFEEFNRLLTKFIEENN